MLTDAQVEELNREFGLPEVEPDVTLTIHKGTGEIGGNCIQLTCENTTILLDIGSPLDEDSQPVDYGRLTADAVIISHPHQDHYGMAEALDSSIPIYCGALTHRLMDTGRILSGKKPLNRKFEYFEKWEPFEIGPFWIKPFLVDHSAVDAYAFLIKVGEKDIFYSGDFRAHGRKSVLFENILKHPPRDIDVLLLEGTMISRDNSEFPDEQSVENAMCEVIEDQLTMSLVCSSSQNVDRIVSVYRACKRKNKHLVIDILTAWTLELIHQLIPECKAPHMSWEDIHVLTKGRKGSYAYGILSDNKEFFGSFVSGVFDHKITHEDLAQDPKKYVLYGNLGSLENLEAVTSEGSETPHVIYSMWKGYLAEKSKKNVKRYLDMLESETIISEYIHTSGHVTVEDMKSFVGALQPKKVVPIHTEKPEAYEDHLGVDVLKASDNTEIII